MLAIPMDDAVYGTGVTAVHSDRSVSEGGGTLREGSCMCCATSEPPVITLTTACVQYLRCPSCGFIRIVRATDAAAAPSTSDGF
jgi:hypothetical protein